MDDQVVLYLMPHKIQKKRYDDMKKAAKCRKFTIVDDFSPEVTHIVTEFETQEQAVRHIGFNTTEENNEESPEFLKISWFTQSIKARKPVEIQDHHRLLRNTQEEVHVEENEGASEPRFPEWACQRSTPLKHQNDFLATQLEILQKYAEMKDENHDYSRALAFRRASCVVKSFPVTVTNVNQLNGINHVGPHSKRVIGELLDGYCDEINRIVNEEWFEKMKMFTGVFGVGPSTAKKWIERGWTSIKDAQESTDISKDWRVQWGLAFHDDLMNPVKSNEAYRFTEIIQTEAEKILPGIVVQLTGGFRRGKHQGHDIDILFTHPNGEETGFLPKLLTRLEKLNMVLCGSHESSSFHEKVLSEDFKLTARGQLDHFEKWLGICKLPKDLVSGDDAQIPLSNGLEKCTEIKENVDSLDDYEPKAKKQRKCHGDNSPFTIATSERDWIARRVDFIMSPYSQYYYALVGWTGSKQFNRDLRLYSQKVLNRKLTSHGFYDFTTGKTLPANSETEVFENLNLQYQHPKNRNC
ncbi:DNA-directed DNA/RNA polymerase mu-like [Mytilus edulis]|uniref:DNA-directed DNA/RNA polymerase mu-like n=1 Tax=Mytilus edulis TaxID=6550 RepID=UPI0039EE77BB